MGYPPYNMRELPIERIICHRQHWWQQYAGWRWSSMGILPLFVLVWILIWWKIWRDYPIELYFTIGWSLQHLYHYLIEATVADLPTADPCDPFLYTYIEENSLTINFFDSKQLIFSIHFENKKIKMSIGIRF